MIPLHPAYERWLAESGIDHSERAECEWAVVMLQRWRRENGYSADGEMSHTDHEAFSAWVEGQK